MNIYAGRAFGWGWPEHVEHGYLGGDDMKTAVGERILAPVAGTVTRTSHSFTITEPDGWKTQALELGSTLSMNTVEVGHGIGFAGTKWVHWHSITPDGTRVPARFLQPEKEHPMPIVVERVGADSARPHLAGMVAYFSEGFYTAFAGPTAITEATWTAQKLTPAGAIVQVDHSKFDLLTSVYHIPAGVLAPGGRWSQDEANAAAIAGITTGSGGLTSVQNTQLMSIPTSAQMAAVLTTQTADINQNTDAARDAVIDEINGITLSAS